MKNIFATFIFFNLFSITISAQLKDITISQLWEDYTFYPKMVPGFNFMKDGKHYSIKENNKIVQYDLTSGEKTNHCLFWRNHEIIFRSLRLLVEG